jgi:ornithine cyclodeaminase/alanine dehydrogenase-like protein (mu-crystallin family)
MVAAADQPAGLAFYDRTAIRAALSPMRAVETVRDALAAGLDPDADIPRWSVPLRHGAFLLMPSDFGRYAGVKVLTSAPDNPAHGRPRIQGVYLLFDAPTATPKALLDGPELTAIRTAAVSMAAVMDRLVTTENPLRVVVFGAGAQAHSHVRTLLAVIEGTRALDDLVVAVRTPRGAIALTGVDATTVAIGTAAADRAVARADLIICATGSDVPLFDGTLVADHATVVCVGAHEPGAREVDDELIARSTVMVESPAMAARQVGAVIHAAAAGRCDYRGLVAMRRCGNLDGVASTGPLVFISVGMSWEDLVIASAVVDAGPEQILTRSNQSL